MINSLETKSEGNSTYNTINNKQNITKEMEDTYTKKLELCNEQYWRRPNKKTKHGKAVYVEDLNVERRLILA